MTTIEALPTWPAWLAGHDGAVATDAEGIVVVDVTPDRWREAVASARDELGATWFNALTAVDEADGSFSVVLGVAVVGTPLRLLHLRTRVGGDPPTLASIDDLYAGAAWCQREVREMFGIEFGGAVDERRLLLSDAFDGTPLRKDAVLAARGTRAWPGAKDPGESDADVAGGHGGGAAPRRRRRRQQGPGAPARDDEGRW